MAANPMKEMKMKTGSYGIDWTHGVLTDHVPTDAMVVFIRGEAFVREGRERTPILCGDIIEIPTEDGPISGRCGCPVGQGTGELAKTYDVGCEGHAAAHHEWLAMDELAKLEWEKAQDRV